MGYMGQFHVGDMVNVMRAGSLVAAVADSAAPVAAPVLLATVSGAILLVAQLQPATFDFLRQLEERLAGAIKAVGRIPHAAWRSFNTDIKTEPAEGFVDGDLIEAFLDLDRDVQKDTIQGMQVPPPLPRPAENPPPHPRPPPGPSRGSCLSQIDDGDGMMRDATVDDIIKIVEDLTRIH